MQSKDISAVLAKDAFLVFRALCKLSTRSSESSTGADPTAIRGKVGSYKTPHTAPICVAYRQSCITLYARGAARMSYPVAKTESKNVMQGHWVALSAAFWS